jgi:hypothetical protein
MICQPHLERAGKRIPAVREVAGTPMCRECFADIEEKPKNKVDVRKWRARSFATRMKIAETRRRKFAAGELSREPMRREMRRRWQDPIIRKRMIEAVHGKEVAENWCAK